MGFHPAWKWERVVRLELDEGAIIASTDVSAETARERERHAGEPLGPEPGADQQTVRRWIRDTFDRSIRRLRDRDEPPAKERLRGD
jgi:hypothetical protein